MATNTTAASTSGDGSLYSVATGTFIMPMANQNLQSYTITTGGGSNTLDGDLLENSLKITTENRIWELEEKIKKLEQAEAERIKQQENTKYFNTDGSSREWYHLDSMLSHMISWSMGGLNKIISADNLQERKYGFVCINTGHIWEIKINIVQGLEEHMFINNGKAILVPNAFYWADENKLLLEMINGK